MHIPSWQKGSIEQKRKQFRKFFPKRYSFKRYSFNNLSQDKLDLINSETYYQNGKHVKLNKAVYLDELEFIL